MSAGFRVRSEADARRVIDHFNGFHDGFLQELRLRSRDGFTQQGPEPWDVGHQVSGLFDAVLDVAHYNYGDGPRPIDRIVRCRFSDVSEFHLDLRGMRSYEWPIQNTAIVNGRRQRENGVDETCFRIRFSWSALEGERWTTRSAELFAFGSADFEEL